MFFQAESSDLSHMGAHTGMGVISVLALLRANTVCYIDQINCHLLFNFFTSCYVVAMPRLLHFQQQSSSLNSLNIFFDFLDRVDRREFR